MGVKGQEIERKSERLRTRDREIEGDEERGRQTDRCRDRLRQSY